MDDFVNVESDEGASTWIDDELTVGNETDTGHKNHHRPTGTYSVFS